jgi:SAM-dependent methyltransferase
MSKRSAICENWYQTLSGKSSLDELDSLCAETLSEIFGYYAVEMGVISEQHSLLKHSRITTAFTLFDKANASKCAVSTPFGENTGLPSSLIATTEQLPIATDNVDLVIASHTLESSQDPHQVLREIDRILVPEGHCILIGFNPLSLSQIIPQLGQKIKMRFNRGNDNNAYKKQSVARVRDWFSLLGFEVVDVHYMGVRPAVKNKRLFESLSWLERLGEYAGPVLGNMYVIHAKKQMVAMRPDKKVWRAPAVLSGGKVVLNNTAQKIRRQNISNL